MSACAGVQRSTVLALALAGLFIVLLHSAPSPSSVSDRSDQRRLAFRRREAIIQHQRRWTVESSATAARAQRAITPDDSACTADRRPYHVLLTASTGAYQEWQSRLFYYHYVKLKRLSPCSDMGGFTRLLTTPGAKPDALMEELPTILEAELSAAETLNFVVLNRPHSLLSALKRGALKFPEQYLLIAETDHLLIKPISNLAKPGVCVGYPFHCTYARPASNST